MKVVIFRSGSIAAVVHNSECQVALDYLTASRKPLSKSIAEDGIYTSKKAGLLISLYSDELCSPEIITLLFICYISVFEKLHISRWYALKLL